MSIIRKEQLTNPLSASYALTASYALSANVAFNTSSLLVTASVDSNVITFTKGNGSSFDITIDTGSVAPMDTSSLVTTASFNAFTSSINQFTSSYNTGSFTGSFTGNFTGTASWAESASQALTASYYKETDPIFTAKSASFATTGSNIFKGNQIVSGSVTILIPPGSAYGINENPTSNNIFWSYPSQDTNTSNIQIGWTAQVAGGGTYIVTNVEPNVPFAPFIAITLSDPSLTLSYRVGVTFSKNAYQWNFNSDGTTTIPGNTHITGSLNVLNGITGSFYGTSSWAESASQALTASYYQETDPIFTSKSSSFATTGSNIFIGDQIITGSINITGSIVLNSNSQITSLFQSNSIDIVAGPGGWAELVSNNTQSFIWVDNDGAYIGTNWDTTPYQWEFRNDGYFVLPQVQSLTKQAGILSEGDIIIQADQTQSWRFVSGSGVLSAPGGIEAPSFTGSLQGTASWAESSSQALTASHAPAYLPLTGGTITGDVIVNGTASVAFLHVTYESASVIYSSGSNQFGDATNNTQTLIGRVIVSGSLEVTGSTHIPNLTGSLYGTSSWAISASQALTASYALSSPGTPGGPYNSIQFNNNGVFSGSSNFTFASASNIVSLTGSMKFVATNDPDPTGLQFVSASFLFVSASNTTLGYDLHFRQDGNLVKWKWIEGALSTGLLYGGTLSYDNNSQYNIRVSSGSGLIIKPNATLHSEVNPQIKYVTWGNLSASIATGSAQSTYAYIDEFGALQTQNTFFTPEQYAANIPLGMFNHTGRNLITSVTGDVYTTYNTTNQAFDFIQAFGPLKISGLTVGGQAGSLRLNIGAGESYILGGFYQQDPDNISHKPTNAYLTASIARVYRSGSTFITDNNNGAFYTTIDPTKWDDGTGVLKTTNAYTIQRVFFNPATGRCHIYYGQKTYNNITEATTNLTTDAFTEASYSTHQYVLAGYLVVKGGTNDLTNIENTIVQAGLFRNTVGNSGGSLIPANLQDLGNVSITSPTTGQALVYNSGTTKWTNGNPLSSSYADTASFASTATTATTLSSQASIDEINNGNGGGFVRPDELEQSKYATLNIYNYNNFT